MLPINLLYDKHRYPRTYKIRALPRRIKNLSGELFIGVSMIVIVCLIPAFLVYMEVERLRTRCRHCGHIGYMQIYHSQGQDTRYRCGRCNARYEGFGDTWRDMSSPEYDELFGKHRSVRSLLRAASRPNEKGVDLVRPSESKSAETPAEQLLRPGD